MSARPETGICEPPVGKRELVEEGTGEIFRDILFSNTSSGPAGLAKASQSGGKPCETVEGLPPIHTAAAERESRLRRLAAESKARQRTRKKKNITNVRFDARKSDVQLFEHLASTWQISEPDTFRRIVRIAYNAKRPVLPQTSISRTILETDHPSHNVSGVTGQNSHGLAQ